MSKEKKIAIGMMAVAGIGMAIAIFNIPVVTKIIIALCTGIGFIGYKIYIKN